MEASKKFTRARTRLIIENPFFGALALRLDVIELPGIGTAATDGAHLWYDPAFIDKLTDPQVKGLVAHEVMHCALDHPWRLMARDKERWNIATDLAINGALKEAKFELPPGGLLDSKYDNMSSEEIYNRLPPSKKKNSGGDNPFKGTGSGPGFGPAIDPGQCGGVVAPQRGANADQSRSDWQIAVTQAAHAARAAGRLPASLERAILTAREPEIDIAAILRRFLATSHPGDYTWTKPNRRYMSMGMYLPGMRPDRLRCVVVAIDTSGSIDQETLSNFSAVLSDVTDEAHPEDIHVIYCDAAVQRTEQYAGGDKIDLRAKGGGGTDFKPPFQWVEKQGIQPDAFIYLTDLQCSSFPQKTDYPVLWLTVDAEEAPFGDIIRIKRQKR